MRIVFGWRSFKLGSFTAIELGIYQIEAAGYSFELRQRYFHLFWIPVFSLGKMWVIRKEARLYELPAELKVALEPIRTRHKTPWYTFSGLILAAIIWFGSWVHDVNQNKYYHEQDKIYFENDKAIMEDKLSHLTTRDIITVTATEYQKPNMDLFLKVEDIKGDTLSITPVESESSNRLDVERVYYQYANTTPSVKISFKRLAGTYPLQFDSSSRAGSNAVIRMAKDLIGNGKKYYIKDVVRHFGPRLENGDNGSFERDISLRFYSMGWSAVVTDIKTLQGTIDWSQNVNKTVPENHSPYSDGTNFFLLGKNYNPGDPYKFVMTLKDSTGQIIKYEVEGQGRERTVREL